LDEAIARFNPDAKAKIEAEKKSEPKPVEDKSTEKIDEKPEVKDEKPAEEKLKPETIKKKKAEVKPEEEKKAE
jgi:hypothetical protein